MPEQGTLRYGASRFILCMAGEAHGPGGCLENLKISKNVVKVAVADEGREAGGKDYEMDKTELLSYQRKLIISARPCPTNLSMTRAP
ncbi:MAG: hypothetical protein ACLRMW_05385 [[Clostridium] symbiosum]